jgi:hypothetical protein
MRFLTLKFYHFSANAIPLYTKLHQSTEPTLRHKLHQQIEVYS